MDNMPKQSTSTRSNLNISNKKINTSSTSIQPTSTKLNPKTSLTLRSVTTTSVTNSNRSNISPSSNSQSHTIIKTYPPITSTTLHADNTQTTSTIANNSNYDISTYSQPQLTHIFNSTINHNTFNNINFASAAAMEKTPNREQAIVFNSIDGIPQKDNILAIGKKVLPKVRT